MMKPILTTIAFLALAVAGLAQTRSVIVNTSGVIQSPTNFWSANATNARSGLGLGTAATNAASAFQPSSLVLSNLSSSNGSALTNLTAANITGTVALASNVTGTIAISNGGSGATTAGGARTNLGLGVTNEVTFGSVRSSGLFVSIGTNDYFYAADDMLEVYVPMTIYGTYGISFATNVAAAQTRTNLSLGASWLTNTNAVSFRTAIGALATNGDGSGLTNLTASSVTGTLAISNGGSGATTAGGARTNFGLGWSALTNLQSSLYSGTATELLGYTTEAVAGSGSLTGFKILAYTNTSSLVIPANLLIAEDAIPAPRNLRHVEIRGTATIGHPYTDDTIFGANYASVTDQLTFTNTIATWSSNAVTMGMPIAFSTNVSAAITRTNLGLGWSALTNTSTANALLGYNTNNGNVVMPSSLTFSNNVSFSQSIFATTNGISAGGTLFAGSGSTISFSATEDQSRWRTNLGLGASWLTNTNVTNFKTAIGLGEVTSSGGVFKISTAGTERFSVDAGGDVRVQTGQFILSGNSSAISFSTNNTSGAATTRTNLGLGWSALTNGNTAGFNTSLYGSGTNPVLYNTNGAVVSPTNFWQLAPIVTRFVESQPNTNSTTNIAAARSLHIHSLNTNVINVTNTIVLPEDNSFNGDIALVVHQGSTSGVTLVTTDSGYTTLATMNKFEEAIEFVYYNNTWQFNHNQSFVEPIFFSGTNAAGHAAESRTNLGLGSTNDVTFSTLTLSSDLTFGSGDNIVLSTTTGTKIGTATNQLLGFYNQTPITRPSSTGVTTNGFTTGGGGGTAVHANSTFTGNIGTNAYTISDVVAHLKSLGLLAP